MGLSPVQLTAAAELLEVYSHASVSRRYRAIFDSQKRASGVRWISTQDVRKNFARCLEFALKH